MMKKQENLLSSRESDYICDYKGRQIYDSRYIGINLSLITFDKETSSYKLLISKRSNNCDNSGLWNIPGGYLNWNETTKQGAIRELYEETSVLVELKDVVLFGINDNTSNQNQNVTIRYVCFDLKGKYYQDLNNTSNSEVTENTWIDLLNCNLDLYNFAFNHDLLIKELRVKLMSLI